MYSWQHYTKVGHAQSITAAAPAPEQSGQPGNSTAMLKEQPATAATDPTKETRAVVTPRQKVQTYKVLEGDTVDTIAVKFGLKPSSILWSNDMSVDDSLQSGQELQVPAVDGLVYTIQRDDTLWGIANDASVPERTILQANPDLDPANLQPGLVLLLPDGQPSMRRMVASRGSANSGRPSGHKLVNWPASGPLTDAFGWRIHPVYGTHSFHDGMDISVASGTPLVAAASGTVTMAGRNGGYGLVVRIDHGGGIETEYAHMSEITVAVGHKVGAGEQIGLSGNTGVSTGPHLHFMVIVDDTPTDPASWLP
jgi:murein DD-endopeptidase MepM/ murein hydrolase activator NlpD